MISGQIDGELNAAGLRRLERHLAACVDCRRVREDLIALAREARGLETPPPSDRVWAGIRAGLAAGRREVPAVAPRLRPRAWVPGVSPALRYAAAGLLALLLVVGGAFLGQRILKSPGPAVIVKGGMSFTLAKLAEAESHYRQAVKALKEAVAAQAANYAPQVEDLVSKELAGIDALIKTSEDAVRRDPDDLRARAALLDAFRSEVDFLEQAVDLGRASSPPPKAAAKI